MYSLKISFDKKNSLIYLQAEHLSIHGSFNISFSFRTTARDGIVMLIVDPVTSDSFFVELYDSQVIS